MGWGRGMLGLTLPVISTDSHQSVAESYAMPCYAMLCYAMLCYAMLCYAMLCYAMRHAHQLSRRKYTDGHTGKLLAAGADAVRRGSGGP